MKPASAPAPASNPSSPAISDAGVRDFVDQGFHVAPGLVSADEIAELKQDIVDLARGRHPCPSLAPMPEALSDREVQERILCIHMPHYVSPVMRRFAAHPGVAAILGRITAAHLPHWDGSVKCMQSMVFVKPPGKPGQAWHQDERYIPTRDRSLIGAWIAIDDATIANGCLWVIPGSHRSGRMYPVRPHQDPVEYDHSDQAYGFDESQAVPVEVKAGSVVFFNGYLLHKSLRNRSSIHRRALVCHYMNAWSLLPWYQVETPSGRESVGTADKRNVFLVSGVDPYAEKGTEEAAGDIYLRAYTPT